jgi:hypothetical protein
MCDAVEIILARLFLYLSDFNLIFRFVKSMNEKKKTKK